ncbi:MAG: DegQ family serine endoprotease [Alphaproteobacteria bacterium]|nr:DegQ family serine endoprotease [Alphaproteobacteria bacterium]
MFLKPLRTALAAATLLIVTPVMVSGGASAASAPDSFADLAERLLPSVVNISTSQAPEAPSDDGPQFRLPPDSPFQDLFPEFFDRERPQQRPSTSLGSGFIIDASGIIVTNNHVIADADEIRVTLSNDVELPAEIIGRDEKTDIAVLKVDPAGQSLKAVPIGDSSKTRIGDWVIAIGNPFGLGGTVTAGIVSARGRDIGQGRYDDFIQTDASINRGNSGGPMFNMDGEVIGINTAIFSPTGGSVGIGFAVPTSLAGKVIDQLIEFGRTRRGWIGVRIQPVTDDIAETLSLPLARGALVAAVTETGPAEGAGMKAGDVIIEFNGKDIEDPRGLVRIVGDTEVGADTPVTIWRNGEAVDLTIKVGELEEAERTGLLASTPSGDSPVERALGRVGLQLAPVTEGVIERFGLGSNVEGVVVTDVASGSPADDKGMQAGDIILEIDTESVATPGDVVDLMRKAEESNKRSVLVRYLRNGEPELIALPIR